MDFLASSPPGPSFTRRRYSSLATALFSRQRFLLSPFLIWTNIPPKRKKLGNIFYFFLFEGPDFPFCLESKRRERTPLSFSGIRFSRPRFNILTFPLLFGVPSEVTPDFFPFPLRVANMISEGERGFSSPDDRTTAPFRLLP